MFWISITFDDENWVAVDVLLCSSHQCSTMIYAYLYRNVNLYLVYQIGIHVYQYGWRKTYACLLLFFFHITTLYGITKLYRNLLRSVKCIWFEIYIQNSFVTNVINIAIFLKLAESPRTQFYLPPESVISPRNSNTTVYNYKQSCAFILYAKKLGSENKWWRYKAK